MLFIKLREQLILAKGQLYLELRLLFGLVVLVKQPRRTLEPARGLHLKKNAYELI